MALVDSFDSLIFDYGGVLAHHQTGEDQARMAGVANVPADTFTELYWSERPDYDKGLVSGAEYWLSLARKAGTLFSAKIADELTELDSASWMHFDEPMWDWIAQLRKGGKRVAILSNMPLDLGEAVRSRTDKFDQVDFVTLSYEVKSVKPEPAIYDHCLEGLSADPETTLFLDDRIENIRGAELLGVRGIQFTSRDEILTRLL